MIDELVTSNCNDFAILIKGNKELLRYIEIKLLRMRFD